jgi:uncharacterized protein
MPAWTERKWVGRALAIGSAKLRVIAAITRCAATNVDPATGRRNMSIPPALQRTFGHNHMGIYAEVARGSVIALGDALWAI